MNSPITGKPMKLMSKKVTVKFRGKNYECDSEYWLDEDNGEQFTTSEQDDKALQQIYKQAGFKPDKYL